MAKGTKPAASATKETKPAAATKDTPAASAQKRVPMIGDTVILHEHGKKIAAIIADVVSDTVIGLRALPPDHSGHSLAPYYANVQQRTQDTGFARSWDWRDMV